MKAAARIEGRETASDALRALVRTPAATLLGLASRGTAPDPLRLAGWEFRASWTAGSLPAVAGARHRRGFYRMRSAPRGSTGVAGYSIPCHRGGPDDPWVDRLRGPAALRRGWCVLFPGGGPRFPDSLLVDYSRAGRLHRIHPLSVLREHLVRIAPDDPDLLVAVREARVGGQVRHLGIAVMERHVRSNLVP